MKAIFFSLLVLTLCSSCLPKIEGFSVSPSQFCGCTNVTVEYLVTDATTATFTTNPAVSVPTVIIGTRSIASIRVCANTTITLTATNRDGSVRSEGIVTRVDPIPIYSNVLQPCAVASGVWGTSTDLLHPPTGNADIQTVEITTDRAGTLSGAGVSVQVRPGHNIFTEFLGKDPIEAFDFAAPLMVTETCSPGTTSGDSRVTPPNFNLIMTLRCRS